MTEKAIWKPVWRVEKYGSDGTLLEVVEVEGNILTTAGANAMLTALTGGTITPFSAANARLGVGDGTTAESASQTDLQGTNKLRKALDSGYPLVNGNQLVFQATFGSTEANFAWNEVAAFNAATGGTMLNRKVANLGTKASGATWILTLTITLS